MNREIIYGAILGLAVVGAVSMTARSHSNQGRSWRERIAYYPSAETVAQGAALGLSDAERAVYALTAAPTWGAAEANRLALNVLAPDPAPSPGGSPGVDWLRFASLSCIADRFRAGAPIDVDARELLTVVLAREIGRGAIDLTDTGKQRATVTAQMAAWAGLLPDEPRCASALAEFAHVDATAEALQAFWQGEYARYMAARETGTDPADVPELWRR